jgi:hypothetical protein
MSFETPLPPYNSTDPYATFLNASCFDLLLIELVPMAHRIAEGVLRREAAIVTSTANVKMKAGVGGG